MSRATRLRVLVFATCEGSFDAPFLIFMKQHASVQRVIQVWSQNQLK